MCDNLAYDPEPDDTEVRMCKISDYVVRSHIKYFLIYELCYVCLILFCSLGLHCVITRYGLTQREMLR
jgi:hypothetical protein